MAVGFRLSSLRRTAAAVLFVSAMASSPPATAQQAPDLDPDDVRNSDCEKLPGGNAPIQRIARLEGGMSVRNLEMTYFGKPLHALTDNDFAYLRQLWPQCSTFEDEVADRVATRLKALVSDAKLARQDALDWISEVEAQIARLEPGGESIRKIHDLWQEMLNREFEMLPGDLQFLAKKLSDKRDELYRGDQKRQRTLVNPFDPGAPETRDIGG